MPQSEIRFDFVGVRTALGVAQEAWKVELKLRHVQLCHTFWQSVLLVVISSNTTMRRRGLPKCMKLRRGWRN